MGIPTPDMSEKHVSDMSLLDMLSLIPHFSGKLFPSWTRSDLPPITDPFLKELTLQGFISLNKRSLYQVFFPFWPNWTGRTRETLGIQEPCSSFDQDLSRSLVHPSSQRKVSKNESIGLFHLIFLVSSIHELSKRSTYTWTPFLRELLGHVHRSDIKT